MPGQPRPKTKNELDQGIDRASRVVSQLLALARTDGGDPAVVTDKSDVDLNFLVSDVASELIESLAQAAVVGVCLSCRKWPIPMAPA